jgi:formylmethanofuran dehydrogenase subunit E
MKDIKKLEKEDFIEIAEKLKLNDLRKLFNFTHINTETGKKLKAFEGVNCMDCFEIIRNDEHSSRNKNYCRECLQ